MLVQQYLDQFIRIYHFYIKAMISLKINNINILFKFEGKILNFITIKVFVQSKLSVIFEDPHLYSNSVFKSYDYITSYTETPDIVYRM